MNRPPTPTGSLAERASLRDADTAFLSVSPLHGAGDAGWEESQREALDRIAAAARLGDLDAFGRNRAEHAGRDAGAVCGCAAVGIPGAAVAATLGRQRRARVRKALGQAEGEDERQDEPHEAKR